MPRLDLPSQFPEVLISRAIYLDNSGRRREAAMFFREGARLAEEQENAFAAAMAKQNLANALNVDDPVAGAMAARDAIDLGVRLGDVYFLGTSVANRVIALAATADWDEAARTINDNPNAHLFTDDEFFVMAHAWFRALRGDADLADELLGKLNALASRIPRTSPWWRRREHSLPTACHDHLRRCV